MLYLFVSPLYRLGTTMILCATLISTTSFKEHDIHVSIIDIKQAKDQKIEVVVKTFYDDLLTSMGHKLGEPIPSKYKGAQDLIIKFVNKNIKISIDGKPQTLKYVNAEASNPAIWLTLQIDNITNIKGIKIEDLILLNLYNDQVNMVNFEIQGKKESFSLNKKKKIAIFTL
jgi:hypothetical protein